jgi:hypothetical protein
LPAANEACATAVSKGFISVSYSPNVEDGDEITVKNANGEICIADQADSSFKRWDLEIEFCGVDPELLSMMATLTLENDGADAVGFRVPEGTAAEQFALELWTGIPDADQPEEGYEYGYLLLPFVGGGTLGSIDIEDGETTFTVENAYTKGGGQWGVGPFGVVGTAAVPAPLGVPIAKSEHLLLRSTLVAPPEETDGCEAWPAA